MAGKVLPEKICPVCQRPFSWRKRWERNWAEVRYCSERCRRTRLVRPAAHEPADSITKRMPCSNQD